MKIEQLAITRGVHRVKIDGVEFVHATHCFRLAMDEHLAGAAAKQFDELHPGKSRMLKISDGVARAGRYIPASLLTEVSSIITDDNFRKTVRAIVYGGIHSRLKKKVEEKTIETSEIKTVSLPAPKTIFDLNDMTGCKLWLRSMLDRGKRAKFAEVVMLTPTLARVLLDNNPENRNMKSRKIEEMKQDILNDNYVVNGETVILSVEGLLNDGQNRCQAVIDADKPIETFIAFGLPRDTRLSVDQGSARIVADFIKMQGAPNSRDAASVARALWFYERGIVHEGSDAPSKIEATNYYLDHKDEIDAAVSLVKSTSFARDFAVTPVAAAYVILKRHDEKNTDEFFRLLLTGAELKIGSPILLLIHRAKSIVQKRIRSGEKIEYILRTYNTWRSGKVVSKLSAATGNYPKLVK